MLRPLAPRRNSLRDLRSLRSDSRRKNEVEARCARGPSVLRFSAAQQPTHSPPAQRLAKVVALDV